MADTLQHGSISGNASVRQKISGEVVIGGKVMKELRFLPYSEFPEIGREETLYIDTDNNAMYYYDGSSYVALSGGGGGGTDNYNALTNKPSVNSVTLIGDKTSSELGLQELISDLSTIRSGAALGTTAVQPETLETALSDKQDAINDLDDIRSGASAGATAVQPADMETALADKQDVISDLSTIRSGAASGATAVQPSDMETALSSKQDVISDLSDIRSGAASGATAVQPSDMETALSGKQDSISDLQTIRSGAALGATAVQPSDMETALADKQDVISDLDTIRSGATAGNTALQPEDVDTLPTDGSSNPVSSGGTYNFVNSSIATNTAYFIGTFASVAELEAYTGTVTNNDYAFVTSTDSAGNTLYNRYKYNAATLVWSFEYAVNNTAFTTAQWAAIQSGMTSADKTKLDGIETGANKTVIDASPTSGSDNAVSSGGVHTALSGKQDTIADLSDIRSGASAGATAVQPSALNDYQTKLSGTNKLDPSYIDYDASHRAVSDTEKSTWNSKQDAISDLDTIRSGAAAGATALQQSDVASTYSASGTSPVNGTAVNAAIGTLDVSSVGGSGKYISAIAETDGKIEATPTNFDTSLSSSSTNSNAPTSKTVYDDQERQEDEIGAVANRGAKNLLKIDKSQIKSSSWNIDWTWSGDTASNGNASITINQDNTFTVTVSNTMASQVIFDIYLSNDAVSNVILSGCPSGGSSSTHFMYVKGTSYYDTGNGVTFSKTGQFRIAIVVASGHAAGTYIFKPMIRPASITDPTFQPYAKTNCELTVTEGEDRAALAEVIDGGAAGTKNHCTQASGSNNPSSDRWINIPVSDVGVGQWVMSFGTLTSTDTDDTLCQAICFNSKNQQVSNWVNFKREPNTNKTFTITDTVSYVRLYPANSYAASEGDTVTFTDAMLSKKVLYDADPSYVPYAPALTNIIITPALIEQVDKGSKNLLNLNTDFTTYTYKGITYKDNRDGTVNVSGTSTAGDSYINLYDRNTDNLFGIQKGETVVLRSTSDNVSVNLIYKKSGGGYGLTVYGYKSSPGWFTVPSNFAGFLLRIGVPKSGTTVNEDVGGMICTAADYAVSPEVSPYALPNPTLTPAAIKAVDEGAKNLLKIIATSQSYDDGKITFTVNADQTVTVNATNNHTQQSLVLAYLGQEFYGKTVVISGCPAGGNFSTGYYLLIYKASGSTTIAYDIGYSVTLTIPNEDCRIAIGVRANAVLNNLIFKPMICTAADWAVSQKFVPYAMSNVELTEQVDFLRGKMVYSTVRNSSYTSTYTMDTNDFNGSQVGLYLIYIVNWSTTPSISIYAMAYSGNITSQSTLSKIFGSDVSISLSGATVTYTGAGKIQIVAVR